MNKAANQKRLEQPHDEAGMRRNLADAEDPAELFVNCSSIGGLIGLPGRAAYHAAKHGVLGLAKSAALEYAPRGIRLNAIRPDTIRTPMVEDMFAAGDLSEEEVVRLAPINRLGKATEIADAVLWLCGPMSTSLVGQSVAVNDRYTVGLYIQAAFQPRFARIKEQH